MLALRTSLLALVCAVSTGAYAQSVVVDTDFGDQGWMPNTFSLTTTDQDLMWDRSGRLLHLASFNYSHPSSHITVTRWLANGGRGGLFSGANGPLFALPLMEPYTRTTGRLFEDAQGRLTTIGSLNRPGLGRQAYLSRMFDNGDPDPSLGTEGYRVIDFPTDTEVFETIHLENKFVLLYGRTPPIEGCKLAAIFENGDPDPTFSTITPYLYRYGTCKALLARQDGFVVAHSTGNLLYFDPDGQIITGFKTMEIVNGRVNITNIISWHNKIIAAGTYFRYEGSLSNSIESGMAVYAFLPSGASDSTFNGGAWSFLQETTGEPSGIDGNGPTHGRVGLAEVEGNLVATMSVKLDSARYGLNIVAFDTSGTQIDLGGPGGMAEFDMTRRYGIYPPSRYSASGPLAVNGAQLIVSGTAQHGPVGISRLDSFTFLNLPVSTDEAEHVRAAQLEIYPAPARSLTTIRLTLPAPSQVRIVVVDMLGRTVLSVADHETPAGTHTVPLDVSRLAPGAYVVVAETGTTRQTARLSVVR